MPHHMNASLKVHHSSCNSTYVYIDTEPEKIICCMLEAAVLYAAGSCSSGEGWATFVAEKNCAGA